MATVEHDPYDLDDPIFERAEAIELVMEANPGVAWTPSQLARRTKIETWQARTALDWMVAQRFITSTGNGTWTRYALRSV